MESITILGCTGSIGRQSIEVAEALGLGITAMTGGKNTELMERQARKVKPLFAAMSDEKSANDLRVRLSDTSIRVAGGEDPVALSHGLLVGRKHVLPVV